MFFARANGKLNVVDLGVDYVRFVGEDHVNMIGANLGFNVGDFRVFGEYWKNTSIDDDYDRAWNAGIGYGKMDLEKKPGSFRSELSLQRCRCRSILRRYRIIY